MKAWIGKRERPTATSPKIQILIMARPRYSINAHMHTSMQRVVDCTPHYKQLPGLSTIDTVELLIKHSADPNIHGGCEGGSALSAAAHNSHLDIMELLLDKGADFYKGIPSETSGSLKESTMGIKDDKNDTEQGDEAIDENGEQ